MRLVGRALGTDAVAESRMSAVAKDDGGKEVLFAARHWRAHSAGCGWVGGLVVVVVVVVHVMRQRCGGRSRVAQPQVGGY